MAYTSMKKESETRSGHLAAVDHATRESDIHSLYSTPYHAQNILARAWHSVKHTILSGLFGRYFQELDTQPVYIPEADIHGTLYTEATHQHLYRLTLPRRSSDYLHYLSESGIETLFPDNSKQCLLIKSLAKKLMDYPSESKEVQEIMTRIFNVAIERPEFEPAIETLTLSHNLRELEDSASELEKAQQFIEAESPEEKALRARINALIELRESLEAELQTLSTHF
jgi:hypothetical protein